LKRLIYPAISSLFMLAGVVSLRILLRGWLGSISTLGICIATGVVLYAGTARLLRPDLIKMIEEAFRAILFRAENRVPAPELTGLAEDLASVSSGSSDL
jgi:hypothetical protein